MTRKRNTTDKTKGSLTINSGCLDSQYRRAVKKGVSDAAVQKIMNRQPSLFSSDRKLKKLISNRLGWVDSASLMKRNIKRVEKFGNNALSSGLKHFVLMGMGGSSLCPELFSLFHGKHKRLKSFNVIDSTDPVAIKAIVKKIEIKKTLFIVASKSGGTIETRSHEAYFTALLKDAGVKNIGRHFAAITDKGSNLEEYARRKRYRSVFINPADIGGRYSALSYFGIVPAFFAGVDLGKLIDDALEMQSLLLQRKDDSNPALLLGSLIGAGAKSGRDKLTFIASKKTSPLVPWVEQLVAESTGKKKKGTVPIDAEPMTTAAKYSSDRIFVFLKFTSEIFIKETRLKKKLAKLGHPIVEITLGSLAELGRQFLLWEAATAIAGYQLKINPFDEPNVTESKNNTSKILDALQRAGSLPAPQTMGKTGSLSVIALDKQAGGGKKIGDLKKLLRGFFRGVKPPKYLALLNYYKSDSQSEAQLYNIRKIISSKKNITTLRGYGPRFLHSIGQLYKGGPQDGLFIIFVRSRYGHLPIPGNNFGFGELITAQAIGDSQALMKRKLPTIVIAIDGSPSKGLAEFARLIRAALR